MGQYGEQDIEPGRFGWKGDEPDLAHQISAAFHFDLGLSTPLRRALWGDCTAAQADCRAAPQGADKGGVEVETTVVSLVATYLRALPAPAASQPPPSTERGARAVRRDRLRRLPYVATCRRSSPTARRSGSRPTPTCWCTTWATASPIAPSTIPFRPSPARTSGALPPCGAWALVSQRRTAPTCCMMAAPARCSKRSCGTAARRAGAKQRAAELSAEDRAALIAFLESL